MAQRGSLARAVTAQATRGEPVELEGLPENAAMHSGDVASEGTELHSIADGRVVEFCRVVATILDRMARTSTPTAA